MVADRKACADNALQRVEGPQIDPFSHTAWQEIRPDQPSGDSSSEDANPLSQLLAEASGRVHRRRGRPTVLDDQAKGKLIALLAVGLSMRQAASVIGVSHTTVSDALRADQALADEVTAARFNAQLQPLACVIRESRRSWRAASWLLKHLCETISKRDETPDEAHARYVREQDEFFARGRRQ